MKAMAGIPGPVPSFPAGNMGDFLGRPIWEVCREYGQKYGGISLAWFAGTPAVILNDPDLIGQVLDTDAWSYYKDAPHDAVAPVISPNDLFISNGEQWRLLRQSAPVSPTVDPDWLSQQFPTIRAAVKHVLERRIGSTVEDLIELLRALVFECISRTVWGQTFGDGVYEDFLKLARMGHWRMSEPPPLTKIPPLDPMFYLARERWNKAFRAAASAASANPQREAQDLLHRTLRKGTPLSLEQLAEMLSSSVYFGGVFSTSAAIAYTLLFLCENTEHLAAVRAEIRERSPGSEDFTIAALNSCAQLDHDLRESLRLSPPVPLLARNVLKERSAVLGKHTLPANTFIVITNWLLHRDSAHWSDPEQYRPERWANGGSDRDPYGSGYFFPFGRGPRACVGQEFALVIAKATLAVLLDMANVEIDRSRPPENDFFFAVRHPRQLKVRFTPA